MRNEHKPNLGQIIKLSKANDPLVIEVLVREYYPTLLRLSISILDDIPEAEDAAQEALLAAITHLPQYRGEANLKTWLYAITINTCKGYLRKKKRREALQSTLETLHLLKTEHATSPETQTLISESETQLWKNVDHLKDIHRLPIILRYVHDLSISEIAEVLNLNEGTVHSRLHYARQQLRKMMSQQAGQTEHLEKSS